MTRVDERTGDLRLVRGGQPAFGVERGDGAEGPATTERGRGAPAAGPADPGPRQASRRRGPSGAAGYRHRILVVEDDPKIGDGLRRALVSEGYEVEWVVDGSSAARSASQEPPDLVVLDLYLPDVDGVDVCQDLREAFPTLPIMILSARTDEIDIVVGLDAGADDYLVKPFRLAELLARIRAHLRRPGSLAAQKVSVGDVHVDLAARRVTVGTSDVDLRPKELDLLVLLAANAGRLVSREQIVRELWEPGSSGSAKSLDMHVSSLRRKLSDGGSLTRITTIRGSGYRLDP
jgi:DNA-binding response OmpR family regulator